MKKRIVKPLNIQLVTNNYIITQIDYENIEKLVNQYVEKYSRIYTNFIVYNMTIYVIGENIYEINEENVDFIYCKNGNITFDDIEELNVNEKIYLSKQKIKNIKLEDFFEELRLRPVDENETDLTLHFIGEKYREIKRKYI